MFLLEAVLENSHGNGVLELLGLDPSAEAEPGGLRTRWASGSLGLAGSGLHLRHC